MIRIIITLCIIFAMCAALYAIWKPLKGNGWAYQYDKNLLNMANTISPIITQISERLGEYENFQWSTPAKGGALIYKREPVKGCISETGNVYYIRCYEWDYDEDDRLWCKPIRDVPLDCHSCIPEEDVLIPYWNEKLQNAEMGKKFFIHEKDQ